MPRLPLLAIAGVACTLAFGTAQPLGAAVRHVSYADLDLSTTAGRKAMDHRINAAASSVCAAENRELILARACRRDAIARANVDLARATNATTVQLTSR